MLKKYWLAFCAGVLAITYFLGLKKGKQNARNEQNEATLDAVQKAKKSRDSLRDPAIADELHDRYKR